MVSWALKSSGKGKLNWKAMFSAAYEVICAFWGENKVDVSNQKLNGDNNLPNGTDSVTENKAFSQSLVVEYMMHPHLLSEFSKVGSVH